MHIWRWSQITDFNILAILSVFYQLLLYLPVYSYYLHQYRDQNHMSSLLVLQFHPPSHQRHGQHDYYYQHQHHCKSAFLLFPQGQAKALKQAHTQARASHTHTQSEKNRVELTYHHHYYPFSAVPFGEWTGPLSLTDIPPMGP